MSFVPSELLKEFHAEETPAHPQCRATISVPFMTPEVLREIYPQGSLAHPYWWTSISMSLMRSKLPGKIQPNESSTYLHRRETIPLLYLLQVLCAKLPLEQTHEVTPSWHHWVGHQSFRGASCIRLCLYHESTYVRIMLHGILVHPEAQVSPYGFISWTGTWLQRIFLHNLISWRNIFCENIPLHCHVLACDISMCKSITKKCSFVSFVFKGVVCAMK